MKANTESIFNQVSELLDVPIDSMLGKSRIPKIVLGRCIIVKYLREGGFSMYQIGFLLNRDHATIVHLMKVYNKHSKPKSKYYGIIKKVKMSDYSHRRTMWENEITKHKNRINILTMKINQL